MKTLYPIVCLSLMSLTACGDDVEVTPDAAADSTPPDAMVGAPDAMAPDVGPPDASAPDAARPDAAVDACTEYSWMRATFSCTGDIMGSYVCELVTPSEVRPDGCDLLCTATDSDRTISIRPLPGGSTTELNAPTSFSFLAPPTTCTRE
jgi:hypothetical protein